MEAGHFLILNRRKASGVAFSLALLILVGCSGGREARRHRSEAPISLGLATPPSVSGSYVRSQDGTKLSRTIGPKKRAAYEAAGDAAARPLVTWSGPPNEVRPSSTRELAPGEAGIAMLDLPQPPEALPVQVPGSPPALTPPASATSTLSTAESQNPRTSAAPPKTSSTTSAPQNDLAVIRQLVSEAQARIAGVSSYQAKMTRQERVGETLQPLEEVLLSVRREPFAVRLEWPEGANQGREVLYSPVETAGKLQVYSPKAIVQRISLEPRSPLVMKNSRHPIMEAGLDNILVMLDAQLRTNERGDVAVQAMRYKGRAMVRELGRACHQVEEVRSNGETWLVAIDCESLMPTLVRGTDQQGNLLELYLFREIRVNLPELATTSAFNPDARWSNKNSSILSRLTRSHETEESTVR